jgi:hypothetical protein
MSAGSSIDISEAGIKEIEILKSGLLDNDRSS